MATEKIVTLKVTCDLCNQKEFVDSDNVGNILPTRCAIKHIGSVDERGNFYEKQEALEVGIKELCPACRERAYVEVIAEISQAYSTIPSYSFLKDKVKQGLVSLNDQ